MEKLVSFIVQKATEYTVDNKYVLRVAFWKGGLIFMTISVHSRHILLKFAVYI